MSKKWDFTAWMIDLKEAESVKDKQKTPEEIEKFTIDEKVCSPTVQHSSSVGPELKYVSIIFAAVIGAGACFVADTPVASAATIRAAAVASELASGAALVLFFSFFLFVFDVNVIVPVTIVVFPCRTLCGTCRA
jgi:hypothetical protein